MSKDKPDLPDEIWFCEGCGKITPKEFWQPPPPGLSCCPERKAHSYTRAAPSVDVDNLLDRVERAEEDMEIGADRHQAGTIDSYRELARSGIKYMEGGKPYIDLLETLAAIEHERWSGWMEYSLNNWTPENIDRWSRQMNTPYAELPEHSKESDRREVRKTLAAIPITHLTTKPDNAAAREALERLIRWSADQSRLCNERIAIDQDCKTILKALGGE